MGEGQREQVCGVLQGTDRADTDGGSSAADVAGQWLSLGRCGGKQGAGRRCCSGRLHQPERGWQVTATPAEYNNPFLYGNKDGSLTPEQRALPGAVPNPAAGLAVAAGAAAAVGAEPAAAALVAWLRGCSVNPMVCANQAAVAAGEVAAGSAMPAATGAFVPAGSLASETNTIARIGDRLVLDQRYVSDVGNVACGPTACAMVMNDNGKWVNISQFAADSNLVADVGTNVVTLTQALQKNGLSSASWATGATISDLAAATSQGNAVIARVSIAEGGHFVVVDGITTRLGQSVVAVRDPGTGMQYFVPTNEFADKFTGQVVRTGK